MTAKSDHYLELNDDGTPRRKHDIDPRKAGAPILHSTVLLALLNVFMLLRNVFTWEDKAAGTHELAHLEDKPRSGPSSAHEDGEAAAQQAQNTKDDAPADAAGEDGPIRLGSSGGLRRGNTDFHPIEDASASPRPTPASFLAPANDNEGLYGAAPGHSIGLNADDPFQNLPEPSVGGGESPDPWSLITDDSIPLPRGPGAPGPHGDNDDEDDPDRTANRLPIIASFVVLEALILNKAITITQADLLRHATDQDGTALQISGLSASKGHLVARADGTWTYIPEFNDASLVRFTYQVTDGEASVAQTAYMPFVANPYGALMGTDSGDRLLATDADTIMDGGAGDDVLIGGEGDDVIAGGAGNDRIVAGGGDDVIYGDAGHDVIFAGTGNDTVYGGTGNDVILGESGRDHLYGEAGDDWISGGEDGDFIWGGQGNDTLFGDHGDDTLSGDAGDDDLDGGDGDDMMFGGDGEDVMDGGAGDDALQADGGADIVYGGQGNDVFLATAGDGDDVYDGGEGIDTYDASQTSAPLVIDLAAATASSIDIGTDSIENVENAVGGSGDDILIASDAVNVLAGGAGNDIFVFTSALSAGGGGPGSRDRILDFEVGDRIDLDEIGEEIEDAFNAAFEDTGIRKFVLLAQHQEFTRPGQMRFKYDTVEDTNVTVLQGNTDMDADAEFEIELTGFYELRDEDFFWRA